MDKDKDMSRRRFLKMAALTGAAMCVGPTLNKVTAAERVWMGKQQVANNIPAGMAAVRTRRTLGHGNTAFTVSAMGYGCMGLNHNRSQYPSREKEIALVRMTVGANAVNDLLGRIRGTVNLGRVTPNFYLSLQALEEDGVVRLLSTPKLSTLNGHEATLTSGETQYYKEVQNNYYGTQNPISSESYQWKSVDANLSIKVTPYVSEDRQITLEIEFEQTEFTDRNVEDAPPGTATRSFKSIVKVQNEEMVLLGGLDRNTMENSSRGVPFLARVPVIKWFFGKEKRNKVERTLNIFIKPTVVE